MEGKVKLLRDGQLKTDPKALHDVVCSFLGNTIEWLLEELNEGLAECLEAVEGVPERVQAIYDICAFMKGTRDWAMEDRIQLDNDLAEMVYASGIWEIGGYADPYDYVPLIADFLRKQTGHTQTRKLFAA
jgi:hypothetical protein